MKTVAMTTTTTSFSHPCYTYTSTVGRYLDRMYGNNTHLLLLLGGTLFGRVQEPVFVQETSCSDNRWSIFGVALQTKTNAVGRGLIDVVRNVNGMIWIDNRLELLDKVEIRKGCPAMDHFVQNTTKRPNVRGL